MRQHFWYQEDRLAAAATVLLLQFSDLWERSVTSSRVGLARI